MNKYPLLMRINHWVMALLIIILISVGMWMSELPNDYPGKYDIYDLHKSFGIVAILFVIFRLSVRLRSAIPSLPKEISPFEQKAGHAVHLILYALIFAMPISGYLMSNYGGYPIHFFGKLMPVFVEKNHELGTFFRGVHGYAAWSLIVIISLHVIGSIKHLLIDKVNLAKRMW